MKPIRLFEMFAGYGGASFGLKRACIPFECVGYSEIDKFAIQCYEQNHGNVKNYGDCRNINPNELPDFDLLTGGFPCQPFSVAGRALGAKDERGTLFDDIIRIAAVKQPRWILLENVKGLLSKKHREFYEHTISELNRIGYEVFMIYDKKHKENRIPILNSKDYGIPQNRERVWYICFRDLDDLFKFELPEKEELKIFLKDILENEVDDKYYLSEKVVQRLKLEDSFGFPCYDRKTGKALDNLSNCLRSGQGSGNPKIIQLNNPKYLEDRVYSIEGISPTLNTMQGGQRQPFIKKQKTIIRKLTPKECFRLMGFLNDEINLNGLSDTQKYKLAGNGWDINLVSKIFKQMFKKAIKNEEKLEGGQYELSYFYPRC